MPRATIEYSTRFAASLYRDAARMSPTADRRRRILKDVTSRQVGGIEAGQSLVWINYHVASTWLSRDDKNDVAKPLGI